MIMKTVEKTERHAWRSDEKVWGTPATLKPVFEKLVSQGWFFKSSRFKNGTKLFSLPRLYSPPWNTNLAHA